jgi:hypothetical protein
MFKGSKVQRFKGSMFNVQSFRVLGSNIQRFKRIRHLDIGI